MHGEAKGPRPIAGVRVVLHRVGADNAGPLDSMLTDARGRYHFQYAKSGSPDAIYFVSATATLVYYVVTSWGAAGLLDRVLQLALLTSAIGGVIFMLIAKENLKRPPAAEKSPSSRARQTSAATES